MIKDIFNEKKPTLSFEVFPPKKEDDFANAFAILDKLALLKPDFISVTYGAGGSKSKKTLEIASYIQNQLHINALAHMTCVGSRKEDIDAVAAQMEKEGLKHVLALRGDRPADMSDEQYESRAFAHASDLITYLKETTSLQAAGACYPEKHFEAESMEEDLRHLKEKCEAGAEFLITQLFFGQRQLSPLPGSGRESRNHGSHQRRNHAHHHRKTDRHHRISFRFRCSKKNGRHDRRLCGQPCRPEKSRN